MHQPLLMRPIKLGSQIIQADQRPVIAITRIQIGLGQHASQGHQLFLAARKLIVMGRVLESQTPVRPMRPDAGMATLAIAMTRVKQGLVQLRLAAQPRR